MCHPGYVDDELLRGSAYNRQREGELEVLTSEEVRKVVESNGILLNTFRRLFAGSLADPSEASIHVNFTAK